MKKLFAVIGDPIAHSLSPQMHNELFRHYHIDAHYHALLVRSDTLKEAVMGLKAIGISGFNVTIPHKTTIIPYLDEVDPLAAHIGAVNTVVHSGGKLIGYNTDGLGFLTGLLSLTNELANQRVLVIGAGGAAKAIYYTLAKFGVSQLDLCNRTFEKASQLVQSCPYQINSKAYSIEEAEEFINGYTVIIQTTNIGMFPHEQQSPIQLNNLQPGCILSDIIYNPFETPFLKRGKKLGAITQNGIEMFVHQGALAFQHWTGIAPDVNLMRETVLKQLGGTVC